MFFAYLLGISVIGIIVTIIIEHIRTKKSLLQILKSSCSIDSVQFEKHLGESRTHLYTIVDFVKKHISALRLLVQNYSAKIRYRIRKQLHTDSKHEKPSEFIQKITQ